MKEGTEGVGVRRVEGGLTRPPPHRASQASGSLPYSGSPSKPILFHLGPSQPFMSQQVALGIRKKWSLACGVSGTKLEARKHRLLPPCCKGPELQGEAVPALPFTALRPGAAHLL